MSRLNPEIQFQFYVFNTFYTGLGSIVLVQAAMDKFVQSDLLQSGPNFFQSPI